MQESDSPNTKVRALLRSLEAFQPMCSAVLEGIHPGRIFVDEHAQPRSAFLSTFLGSEHHGAWGFLAGEPGNVGFNRALNHAIYKREAVSQRAPVVLFTYHPDGWQEQLATICTPRPPVPVPRRHYVGRRQVTNWRPRVPRGFNVHPMDQTLLHWPGLEIPAEVRDTLARWCSSTDSGLQDYGFVAIHQDEQGAKVVSCTTVDFVVGGEGDAGLFTVEAYRGRSLATITAAAALEHGFTAGMSAVHWTCDEDNLPSFRTAERLGLEHEGDYCMYVLFLG